MTSVHITWGFLENVNTIDRAFIYEPTYNNWGAYCTKLKELPDLRRLAVTPTFYHNPEKYRSFNETSYRDCIMFYLRFLNNVTVKDSFTVTLPWDTRPLHQQKYPFIGTDELLPITRNFEVKRIHQYLSFSVDTFFFPFDLECLHCGPGSVLHKGTKGSAEYVQFENFEHTPWIPLVWTQHTRCGGWLEFGFTGEGGYRGRPRCTQGGREIV